MATDYICGVCGSWLVWNLNEETDDFAWWCTSCEEWIDKKSTVKVIELDKQEIAYKKAQRKRWKG